MDSNNDVKNFDLNSLNDIDTTTPVHLITPLPQPHSTDDQPSILKTQKSIDVKIDWFTRVLDSLEKLSDKNSDLESRIYNNRSYLSSNIASTRDYIYSELKHLRSDFNKCKETHHNTMDATKYKLDTKIECISNKVIEESRRLEDKILIDLPKTLEKLNIKVEKLSETITSIRIKIATIGTIGGLLGSICLFIFQIIFKKYF